MSLSAPRRLNWVTILSILLLVGGSYWGFKFGPVYWQRYKVDEALTDVAFGAIDLRQQTPDGRSAQEQALVERARARITELGIDPETLNVYFDADMENVHAEYVVTVRHPVLDPTELHFHRAVRVPGDDTQPEP